MHRGRVETGEQRHHVGDVGRQRVRRGIGEAVRLAAADDVGADDAPAVLHRPREDIEVAALARDAVGADEDAVARAARALPLPVGHAVQAAGVEALDVAKCRFGHGVRHFIWIVPLTVAVTAAWPGSTDRASADAGLAACIRIVGAGPGCGSLVESVTSRTA